MTTVSLQLAGNTTLTGTTLIVTYDTAVPAETRCWGTIKGIYR